MLLKAFLRKQWGFITMVSMMVVMLLVSTQVLMTHQFKHETMIERVIRANAPQVMIHVHAFRFVQDIENAITSYNEMIEQDGDYVHFEKTTVLNVKRNNFGLLFEILTDTHKASLPVLEGKPLNEIAAHEAAIVQSYANELRNKGIDPFSYTLSLDTVLGIKTFQVVSIIDYPNYNDTYIPDNGLKSIPLFDFPYPSVALILEDQVTNALSQEVETFFYDMRLVRTEFAPGVSQSFHLRLEEYSQESERQLMAFLYRNLGYYPDNITFYPLYEYSDYLSTNEQLYSMITRYGLWGMSLLSALGLVVLLRQQFLQNIKSLGLMITLGHSYVRVTIILISRFVFAWILGLFSWIILNVITYPVIQSQREIAKIIDQTNLILGYTALAVSLIYVLWILISGYYSVRTLKYANGALKHQRKNTISFFPVGKNWKVNVAIKGMLSRFGFTMSMIMMFAIITSMSVSFLLIFNQVSSIYNEKTLGVNFDYLVLDAPFRHYEITDTVAHSQVWIEKITNYLFVDVHYARNYYSYYKSSVLNFMGNMEGFVTPIEGSTPDDLNKVFWEYKNDIRYAMASRKQMERTNSFVYSIERVEQERSAERGYLFISSISPSRANKETAAQIQGTMNTLLDQGWIAYVYRSQPMIEIAVPYMEMYLFNMKEGLSNQEVEDVMDEHGIKYMSYKQIIEILNEVNRVNQRQTFTFIIVSVSLLWMLLLVVISNYFKTMRLEQRDNTALMMQLGLRNETYRQMKVAQRGYIFISGLIASTIILPILFSTMHEDMLKAYGLYTTKALPLPILFSIGLIPVIVILVYAIKYNVVGNKDA